MSTKSVEAWVCDKCEHVWYTNGAKPKRCARCKSPRWDGKGVMPNASPNKTRRKTSRTEEAGEAPSRKRKTSARVIEQAPAVKDPEPDQELIPGVKCHCNFGMYEKRHHTTGAAKWFCVGPTVHVCDPRPIPPSAPVGDQFDEEDFPEGFGQ
jgi:hypothetical protein